MRHYYNEYDPKAAAWIRQLIADGAIPDGFVDDRSITEVTPDDLRDFIQCHFFAGVAGWAASLALAGVSPDEPLWTASLPCQPFSSAGKQAGTDDDRHLWPVFYKLVKACRPPVIIGEQVASKLARTEWFPGVRLDLERMGYAVGCADLCAPCAGEVGEGWIVRGDQGGWEDIIIGAPHIRQRLYWVASGDRRLEDARSNGTGSVLGATNGCGRQPVDAGTAGLRQTHGTTGASGADPRGTGGDATVGLADSERSGREVAVQSGVGSGTQSGEREAGLSGVCSVHGNWKRVSFAADCDGHDEETGELGGICSICGLDYSNDCECPGPTHDGYEYQEFDGILYARLTDGGLGHTERTGPQGLYRDGDDGDRPGRDGETGARPATAPSGPYSGFDLIACRDGKVRRLKSGSAAVVDGLPRGVVPSGDPGDPQYVNNTSEARAMRLKGYGNAICVPLAALFVKSFREVVQ